MTMEWVLLLALLALLVVPIVFALFLVAVVCKLVLLLVTLPFRILGAVLGVGFSALGWLVRGVVFLVVLGVLLVLGILPLLPLLLIAGGLYLVFRGMRSRSAPIAQA